MRLLERNSDGEFSLTKDFGDHVSRYAILSHTWGADTEEVTFKDLMDGTGKSKDGYDKIRFCGEQAGRDGVQYFWVDTCCIEKSNSTELAEAINSMFRWYRNAAKCYVYLSDVSTTKRKASNQFSEFTWEPAFQTSRWFCYRQKIARPRVKKTRRDHTQSPQPCPAAGAVQQSDSRASPLLERRHREDVARSDAHNRSTSPVELASAASTPSTALKTTDLGELQPGALVTDSDEDWEIRNIIGRKVVDGEVHYWVDWEPSWMPESELDGDGGGKRPLKRGQLGIEQFDVLGEPEPKKRRGQPRKQT
jgi:hypothetical protein